jgi:FkbM family methyltransferase
MSILKESFIDFCKSRNRASLQRKLSAGSFIYGAGGYGRRILSLLRENNFECLGIIDKKFTLNKNIISDLPAINPDAFQASMAEGRCLIVGIHNQCVSIDEIFDFAKRFNFSDVIWNADLPDVFGHAADNYWLTDRQFTIDHFDRAAKASRFLADEKSRILFNDILNFRITGHSTWIMKSDFEHQYFPADLIAFDRPITFVDGGAYTGDTFRNLILNNILIGHWIAFEPDPNNFLALARTASELAAKATLFPCGLSDKFDHIAFQANEGAASHLSSSSGRLQVPCVSLDEVFNGFAIDYIKLDIEGAEIDALNGMANIIKRDKPHLAVSMYHQPNHLWLIIETLADLASYANLYIRQHGENGFDTVAYAVPR